MTLTLTLAGILLTIIGGMIFYIIKLSKVCQSQEEEIERLKENEKINRELLTGIVHDVPSARRVWDKIRKKYSPETNDNISK